MINIFDLEQRIKARLTPWIVNLNRPENEQNISQYFNEHVLSKSALENTAEFGISKSNPADSAALEAIFHIGAFYKNMADYAEYNLPESQINESMEKSSEYYARAFKIANEKIKNADPKNIETLNFIETVLKQAIHADAEKLIKKYAYKAIGLAWNIGQKKKDKEILRRGLKLANEYYPEAVPKFEELGLYRESDLIEALKQHNKYADALPKEANIETDKKLLEADKGLRNAIRIASWLEKTEFRFTAKERDHDLDAYNTLKNIYSRYWRIMSKEYRRPLARMYARRCWQEAMHELHDYGKRNYYLLSNGLEAARYDDSYKEASEKFYEELKKL
jgi:hypothetical protein